MTDARVWKLPETAHDPADLAAAWSRVVENALAAARAGAGGLAGGGRSTAHDPTAPARAFADFTMQAESDRAGAGELRQGPRLTLAVIPREAGTSLP